MSAKRLAGLRLTASMRYRLREKEKTMKKVRRAILGLVGLMWEIAGDPERGKAVAAARIRRPSYSSSGVATGLAREYITPYSPSRTG